MSRLNGLSTRGKIFVLIVTAIVLLNNFLSAAAFASAGTTALQQGTEMPHASAGTAAAAPSANIVAARSANEAGAAEPAAEAPSTVVRPASGNGSPNEVSAASEDQGYVPASPGAAVESPGAGAVSLFSAAGLSKDVLLIQTSLPWDSNSNYTLLDHLAEQNYINGYDVCSVDGFIAGVDVSRYKVVMFANDQTTSTYQRYEYICDELEFFAKSGGVVIFGACDEGWGGSGTLTGKLPGGVKKETQFQFHNYIADNKHPIVTGEYTDNKTLTNTFLSGNYCSHSSFVESTLPAGANVILRGSDDNRPTLVEYPLGNGMVIASGLTWEYYYPGGPGFSGSTPSYTNAYFSQRAYDDLVVYATDPKMVEVNVTAAQAGGKIVNVPNADVYLYLGPELRRTVQTDENGIAKINVSGISDAEKRNATISATLKVAEGSGTDGAARNKLFNGFGLGGNGEPIRYIYELHSETLNNNGQWMGIKLSDVKNDKLTLKVSEPRLKVNLAVAYLANDETSRSDGYLAKVKNTVNYVAENLAQVTDGHIFINDVILIRARSKAEFYNSAYRSSMADIRIETVINVGDKDKIQSNAHTTGFFWDSRLDDGGYMRVQMSGTNKSWNHQLGSKEYSFAMTHELGHYLMGFYDEYLASDNKSWKKTFLWIFPISGDSKYERPVSNFGLMDNARDSKNGMELSKRQTTYKYLGGDFTTDSKQSYHSVSYREATEDTLAHWMELKGQTYNTSDAGYPLAGEIFDVLNGSTYSALDYGVKYSKAADRDRTAAYPYATVHKYIDLGSDDGVLDLPGAGGGGVIAAAAGIEVLPAAADAVIDLLSIAADSVSRFDGGAGGNFYEYMSDSFNVRSNLSSESEFTADYSAVDEELINEGFLPVSEATELAVNGASDVSGEFYSEVSLLRRGIDFTTLSWYRFNGGGIQKLPTIMSFNIESYQLGLSCEYAGDGIYMLMANPAPEEPLTAPDGLIGKAGKDADGDVIISFSDSNERGAVVYYEFIFCETPFTDIDDEYVYRAVYFPDESGEYVFPLYERGMEGYLTVIARGADGSASDIVGPIPVTGGEADRDGDGIPDWWADEYWLWGDDGTKDIAGSDDDGDGFTNLEEYINGTDPTVPDNIAVTPVYLPGDVNRDGVINAADASLVMLWLVGKAELAGAQLELADINSDGVVNSADASHILLIAGGTSPTAAGAGIIGIHADGRTAFPGDYIDVPIYISADSNCYAMDLQINYDASMLAFDTVQRHNLFGLEQVNQTGGGVIKFAFAGDGPVTEGGVIANLTFRVLRDCIPATEIKITACNPFIITEDYKAVRIPAELTNGFISSETDISYTVTVTAAEGGLAYGGGVYSMGKAVTVTATPNEGYIFEGWYENGEIIDGADAEYVFEAYANRSLEARFRLDIDCEHGEASGIVVREATCVLDGLTVYDCAVCGARLRSEPIPALGHDWDEGVIMPDPPGAKRSGIVTVYTCLRCGVMDMVIAPDPAYFLTVLDSYAENSGAGFHYRRDLVTINAGFRDGYVFNGWISSSGIIFADSKNSVTTIIMPNSNISVTATWVKAGDDDDDGDDDDVISGGVSNPGRTGVGPAIPHTGDGDNDSGDAGGSEEIGDKSAPLAPANPNPAPSFADVTKSDWFYDAVAFVASRGLMIGTNAETSLFSPDMPLTRGMAIMVLYNAEGKPAVDGLENPFTDVADNAYYIDAVKWCADKNIILGYGNFRFGPDDRIARQDFASIIIRYAAYRHSILTNVKVYNAFNDENEISDYAGSAIVVCYETGIMIGKPGNVFDPNAYVTRAESAAILYRYFNALSDN